MVTAPSLQAKLHRLFDQKRRPWIMGVLNATPDSFYAASRNPYSKQALAAVGSFIEEGVDVLDIGGESTRPGAVPVSLQEEMNRILPWVQRIHDSWPDIPLSIDTQKADVARAALAQGASMINDVSALRHDPEMASVLASAQCPVVLMHMQGTPETMQQHPHYDHVVEEVKAFLEDRLACAVHAGISEEHVILDPGIGFGKTLEHNMALLAQLDQLVALGRPVLIGISRKGFIGRLASGDGQPPLPAEERLAGTLAAHLWSVTHGVHGLRVHDVAATQQALNVWQALHHSQWVSA